MAKLFAELLRASFHHSVPARIGYVFARGSLKKLAARLDPRRYNGAMFLGLAGIAVKSHGSTDAFGFANAIGVAADVKRYGLLEKIIDEMARLNAAPGGQRLRHRCRLDMRWRSQAAGTGGYLPERIVTNDELAARLDTSDAWIRQRTGIAERRIAAPGELTSDLATEAARRALERAGMSGGDLDLIVLATATPDQTFPVDRRQGAGAARHEARRRV